MVSGWIQLAKWFNLDRSCSSEGELIVSGPWLPWLSVLFALLPPPSQPLAAAATPFPGQSTLSHLPTPNISSKPWGAEILVSLLPSEAVSLPLQPCIWWVEAQVRFCTLVGEGVQAEKSQESQVIWALLGQGLAGEQASVLYSLPMHCFRLNHVSVAEVSAWLLPNPESPTCGWVGQEPCQSHPLGPKQCLGTWHGTTILHNSEDRISPCRWPSTQESPGSTVLLCRWGGVHSPHFCLLSYAWSAPLFPLAYLDNGMVFCPLRMFVCLSCPWFSQISSCLWCGGTVPECLLRILKSNLL